MLPVSGSGWAEKDQSWHLQSHFLKLCQLACVWFSNQPETSLYQSSSKLPSEIGVFRRYASIWRWSVATYGYQWVLPILIDSHRNIVINYLEARKKMPKFIFWISFKRGMDVPWWSGPGEACWTHSLRVGGSKLSSATCFWLQLIF